MRKAILKYEFSNNSKASFFTYSSFWIRAEIIKYLKEQRSIIRIPHNTKESKLTFIDYNAWEPTMSDDNMVNERKIERDVFITFLKKKLSEKDFQMIDLRYGLTAED